MARISVLPGADCANELIKLTLTGLIVHEMRKKFLRRNKLT